MSNQVTTPSWAAQLNELVYRINSEELLTVPVAFGIASRAIGFRVGLPGPAKAISEHHYQRAKGMLERVAATARRIAPGFPAAKTGKNKPHKRQWIEQQLGLR